MTKHEKQHSGYFGEFGGRFVAELLVSSLDEVETAMKHYLRDPQFQEELRDLLANYAGRQTPLSYCPKLSDELGIRLYLKREDLLHTGAHKVNNTLGQALLAKRMGKTQLIAETGAGQHGVATATAAARLGLKCTVFMGAVDVQRQHHNVMRMELLGARVVPVTSGTQTLKDAINDSMRYWTARQGDAFYCFGTAAGPRPYPLLVREFQAVIGHEMREQLLERTGSLPWGVVACVGGGSNAIGAFHAFVPDEDVRLIGVEAAGTGEPGCYHSAPINLGTLGVLHGMKTFLLQTREGQIMPSHSLAAGLDYPGVGPEHAYLAESKRATYGMANDAQAFDAFKRLSRTEGIIPALESSHAVAWVLNHREDIPDGAVVAVCLSGRGDKDLGIVQEMLTKENKQ